MGTLYAVLTLDRECATWLDAEGIPHPFVSDSSRYPTPREISEVLSQLSGYAVTIELEQGGIWSATVEAADGPWTTVRIRDFRSEETPHEFHFSKGWPEVIFTITERLSQHCGTLVVVDDSGCPPVMVSPGADIGELLRRYKSQ
jgi:hypothetical protein